MRIVLAAAFSVITCGHLNAQGAFENGNVLLEDCKSETNLNFGKCLGYIIGVSDSASGSVQFSAKVKGISIMRTRVCLRDGVTAGQLRDVVVKWLEDNPQWRDLPANGAVEMALANAFPC